MRVYTLIFSRIDLFHKPQIIFLRFSNLISTYINNHKSFLRIYMFFWEFKIRLLSLIALNVRKTVRRSNSIYVNMKCQASKCLTRELRPKLEAKKKTCWEFSLETHFLKLREYIEKLFENRLRVSKSKNWFGIIALK